jgi:hypothetical protein
MNICPTCRQIVRDWIWIDEPSDSVRLFGKQKEIYEAVVKAGKNGIHSERLYDLLYSHDPNGGPDFKCLAVSIRWLNKKLEKKGEKVYAGRNRRFYRLVKI